MSLVLTLPASFQDSTVIVENKTLSGSRDAYVDALLPHVQRRKEAIGIAVAINGEVTSADVYASPALFGKLSRKLLRSYALEALLARTDRRGHQTIVSPAKPAVLAFLADPTKGNVKTETIGESMHRKVLESTSTVLYEYGYQDPKAMVAVAPVHQNYLKK